MGRDRRDPKALGELLLAQTLSARSAYGLGITPAETYDVHVQHITVPDYDGSNDVVTRTPSGADHPEFGTPPARKESVPK